MIVPGFQARDSQGSAQTSTDTDATSTSARQRRSGVRIAGFFLAAVAAVAGTAGTIAGIGDLVGGRDAAASLLLGLLGYCSLAALAHVDAPYDEVDHAPSQWTVDHPLSPRISEVLRCPPAAVAGIDPSLVGVEGWSEPQRLVRGRVSMDRAIDVALRAWMTARGADGLVVVAGDSREGTARTAWSSLRACYPSATVLAVRPPGQNGHGPFASKPLVALGELALSADELGDVIVWVDEADAHLDRGLTTEGLRRLRALLPGALIVLTMPWPALMQLSRSSPDLAEWMWRATENLRVREP